MVVQWMMSFGAKYAGVVVHTLVVTGGFVAEVEVGNSFVEVYEDAIATAVYVAAVEQSNEKGAFGVAAVGCALFS